MDGLQRFSKMIFVFFRGLSSSSTLNKTYTKKTTIFQFFCNFGKFINSFSSIISYVDLSLYSLAARDLDAKLALELSPRYERSLNQLDFNSDLGVWGAYAWHNGGRTRGDKLRNVHHFLASTFGLFRRVT